MPRDTGDLERALRKHSVNGYPVVGPDWFGTGRIVGEGTRILNQLSYRVQADKPIPFKTIADKFGWSTQQIKLETMLDDIRKRGFQQPWSKIPPEIQEQLESGGTASWRDVQEIWLMRAGCLDENQNVTCYDFQADMIEMVSEDLQAGMIVRFHDQKMNKDFDGTVVGIEGSGQNTIVLLEVFEPTPFMDAPEAMDPSKIRPGFYSDHTFKLGYGTYEAFQKTKTKLPPGKAQTDPESRRQVPHYILKDPIPLADIDAFCQKHYPGVAFCVWQCMILYIIPIHPAPVSGEHQGGTFAPLPTDYARSGEISVWDVESFTGE